MNDRHNDLLRIRPTLKKTLEFDTMSVEERFQNSTLRPVIKLQNPLLIVVFLNYINKYKGVFYELGLEKRLAYMENALMKDQKFRNALKGIIIEQFTVEEYLNYIKNSSSLNKRMMQLLLDLLKDQVELFEIPVTDDAS